MILRCLGLCICSVVAVLVIIFPKLSIDESTVVPETMMSGSVVRYSQQSLANNKSFANQSKFLNESIKSSIGPGREKGFVQSHYRRPGPSSSFHADTADKSSKFPSIFSILPNSVLRFKSQDPLRPKSVKVYEKN